MRHCFVFKNVSNIRLSVYQYSITPFIPIGRQPVFLSKIPTDDGVFNIRFDCPNFIGFSIYLDLHFFVTVALED